MNNQKAVLFTSNRPFLRAENIRAVFEEYEGSKVFMQIDPYKPNPELTSPDFSMRVTDEFIGKSPGKAVMIGHGIAGGKLYGLDQPYPYHRRRNAKLLTRVITTSEDMIPLVAKQSGVPEAHVLALGMPRTDAYFDKRKGDGGTELAGKRSYLYVPTYRTREETPLPRVDWKWLDGQLHDDELLAVKPHPVTKTILPEGEYKHIIELPYHKTSAQYLYDCDVVITDFSSIMFDAYLLEKPVVLFEKRKGYLKTRGMYFDYPGGYSSRYCTDEHDLPDVLRDATDLGRIERECIRKVAGACDGHSSRRVCELIRSLE